MRNTVIFFLVLGLATYGASTAPGAEPAPVERKEKQSSFEIDDLNQLMMKAIDNSSNQVKFATPPGEYVVHGRVLDASGQPIAGAQVMLSEETRGLYMYLANFDVTDSAGRFIVQGSPANRTVYVRVGDVYFSLRTGGVEDVVVRLPQTCKISFDVEPDSDLFDDRIWVKAQKAHVGETKIFGDHSTSIAGANAGEFRLAPGQYYVYGYRRLETASGPLRGYAELAQIEVTDKKSQTFQLGRRSGTRMAGSIRDHGLITNEENVIGIELSLSATSFDRQGTWRTIDTILCAADGTFSFPSIPPGSYLLQGTTVVDPKAPAPQAAFPNAITSTQSRKLFKERIEIGGHPIQLELPIEREVNSTAHRVHSILDSEHPQPNVSWSWSDVQVSQLAGLADREGTIAELLRLLKADDTPSGWRWLVIDSLWRIRPISPDTKAALVEALDDPVNHQWRGSILRAFNNMHSEAIEMLDLIISMQDDADWRIRYGVADAMGAIGRSMIRPPDKIIDTAIQLLDDPHGMVRREAAGSLGVLHSPRAVDALRDRMDDPYGPARAMAAWALFESSGKVEPSLSTMIDILETGDHEARKEAAYYLGMFDHRAAGAIEALRANTDYEKKPPFRGTRETIRYQLRGAAERAIEAIEAGIGWQAQPEPFTIRLDSSQQTKVNVMQFEAAWGKATRGLELGIAIDGEKASYRTGERIPIALLVRNATAEPIRFEIDRRLHDIGPELTLSGGKRQYVINTRLLVARRHPVATLPPGGVMLIPHPGLGVGENPRPREQLWHPYVGKPVAGDHKISQRYRFEVFDENEGTKNRIWLTSGEVEVQLL